MKAFFILLWPLLSFAEIKILNFNTMCDVCKGSDYFQYENRLQQIAQQIKKHNPDLVSLQELRTISQVKKITEILTDYHFIATDGFLMSYADPTILYKKNKFTLINSQTYWLGPNQGNFSLGWEVSLPRQLMVARLRYQKREFNFIASHFDNRMKNLENSIIFTNQIAAQLTGPIIFAADTNIAVDTSLYKSLTNMFIDSFDLKKTLSITGSYQSDRDICYLRKGKEFPNCRVEHILIDKKFKWDVANYSIDATTINLSDHRAHIVELKLPRDAPQSSSSESSQK